MTHRVRLRSILRFLKRGATVATEKEKPAWVPSAILHRAFQIAADGHAECVRKGSDIPYLGHLLGVCSLVIEAGGSENQAAAALLHDLLEDTPTTRDELALMLGGDAGAAVAGMVAGCTDTTFARKADIKSEQKVWSKDRKAEAWWNDRKKPYIDKLASTPHSPGHDSYIVVSLADKTYNAENTASDLRGLVGPARDEVWNKFNVGVEHQKLWYRGLVEAYTTDNKTYTPGEQALLDRFIAAVDEMFPGEGGPE